MQERLKKIQEEKAESFKKAQEEAFQRDLETFKEKADKNGEWMTRIRVSEWSW
jgi:translation initiation factor 2 alpha subunit (eIF-2alpha)